MKKYFILGVVLLVVAGCREEGNVASHETHVRDNREIPTHYDELKQVEWLIGKWIDSDEDASIEFIATWDKYKNFITERFKIASLDQPEFEGQQIIAWDPVNKNIRSWVFDSDGGFGEGKWSKNEAGWEVEMIYFLPQGKKASSTFLYTDITSDSYTWQSTNREVEGELLPDIDPVIIKRVGKS